MSVDEFTVLHTSPLITPYDTGMLTDVLNYQRTQICVVEVTPELAALWLTFNSDNRPIRLPDVAKYARDMAEGRWPFIGDPIRIGLDEHGDLKLLDGQHRMMAVVKADVTVPFLIVNGVPADSQVVMDSGRKRTFGNQLTIRHEGDAMVLASTLRYLLLWLNGQPVSHNHAPTHSEMDEFLATYPDVRTSATVGRHAAQMVRVPPTPMSIVHWHAAQQDRTGAAEFFARLADGAGLFPGSPVYALRERLVRIRATKERLTTPEYMYLVLSAWNAYREGRSLIRVQLPKNGLSNSSFPPLLR